MTAYLVKDFKKDFREADARMQMTIIMQMILFDVDRSKKVQTKRNHLAFMNLVKWSVLYMNKKCDAPLTDWHKNLFNKLEELKK